MRQRGIKNREAIAADCSAWIAEDPKARRGNWRKAFADPSKPLYLEIGSGKGRFICETARLHPDRNFIAAEGGANINVRILQKAKEYNLSNLLVIMDYIDDAGDFFTEGELNGIYLNFSDPWPKKRNAKRRLTHREKLAAYEKASAPGALLQVKTDNDALFAFSLDEIRSRGLLLRWVTKDLHHSPYAARNVETEYERKFSAKGKSINCLQAVLRK
ncbi:MAG: tRNA (guanosine(46)-N7)-methyltransferase TrmB [Firmicutes bacterium]|nr:tRNA (guanosine(46)-N7)-methyltransferase TrmB [Bacillota bacterium]